MRELVGGVLGFIIGGPIGAAIGIGISVALDDEPVVAPPEVDVRSWWRGDKGSPVTLSGAPQTRPALPLLSIPSPSLPPGSDALSWYQDRIDHRQPVFQENPVHITQPVTIELETWSGQILTDLPAITVMED